MDVKVYDSEYVRALEASVVVGGRVNESGQLVLERGNGEEFNAGQVVPSLDIRYPVGSLYTNASVDTDPAVLLGGGVWERYGKGKTIVSLNEAEAEFNTLNETGGEKTHQLSSAEMPSHSHLAQYPNDDGVAFTDGGHSVLVLSGVAREEPTSPTGGDQPHNNLQPYIVAYVWRRTA